MSNFMPQVIGGLEAAHRVKELRGLDERLAMQDRVLDLQMKHMQVRAANAQLNEKLSAAQMQTELRGLEAQRTQEPPVRMAGGKFMIYEAGKERVVDGKHPRVQAMQAEAARQGRRDYYSDLKEQNEAATLAPKRMTEEDWSVKEADATVTGIEKYMGLRDKSGVSLDDMIAKARGAIQQARGQARAADKGPLMNWATASQANKDSVTNVLGAAKQLEWEGLQAPQELQAFIDRRVAEELQAYERDNTPQSERRSVYNITEKIIRQMERDAMKEGVRF